MREGAEAARVAVVGLGVATSLGLDVEETWRAVLAGRSGVANINQFPSDSFPIHIGSEVNIEMLRARLEQPEIQASTRTQTFARWAADRAWADAGLPAPFGNARAGVCVGAGLFPAIEDRLDQLAPIFVAGPPSRPENPGPLWRDPGTSEGWFVHDDLGSVSADLAARFGLQGPSLTLHAACASATQAIGEAWHLIRQGRAEIMLTGGADSMLSMFAVAGFTLLGALSRHSIEAGASRPFDRTRDGFVLGEGAGIVVLEALEHARARGARIYAEVIGYGSSLDAYRFTDIHPEGWGAAECMRRALASAAIRPEDVGYINAHGTATRQNDVVETRALKEVFGPAVRQLAVSSTKSQLGHLLCAAGGVEFIFTVLALRDQVLPPTINLRQPDSECDLDYVAETCRPAAVDVALSNSFGFGGENGTLAVKRWAAGSRLRLGPPAVVSSRRRREERVLITGLGAVSSLGLNVDTHWTRLIAGETGVRRLNAERAAGLSIRLHAPADRQQAVERIRNRMLKKLLLPSGTFAAVAAGEALTDAGLTGDTARLDACGLYFGSLTYELSGRTFEPALRTAFGSTGFDFDRFARIGLDLVDPLLIVKGLPNAALCGVAIEHQLRGPNANFTNGQTGGLQALAIAADAVRHGIVQVALVGGSDSLLVPERLLAEDHSGRLHAEEEPPWVGARPFDARRRGYVPGEGAAVVVIESAGHAATRGARAYAEIFGAGEITTTSCMGRDDGRALAASAREALREGMPRGGETPNVILATGLGTQEDDRREAQASRCLFPGPHDVSLTAATGAIGATGVASGVFGVIHAARGFAANIIPPATGHERASADCDFPVCARAEHRLFSSALVWNSDGARHISLLIGRPA